MAILGAAKSNADPSRQPHDRHFATIMVIEPFMAICHNKAPSCCGPAAISNFEPRDRPFPATSVPSPNRRRWRACGEVIPLNF
jgi:hypothetical protein